MVAIGTTLSVCFKTHFSCRQHQLLNDTEKKWSLSQAHLCSGPTSAAGTVCRTLCKRRHASLASDIATYNIEGASGSWRIQLILSESTLRLKQYLNSLTVWRRPPKHKTLPKPTILGISQLKPSGHHFVHFTQKRSYRELLLLLILIGWLWMSGGFAFTTMESQTSTSIMFSPVTQKIWHAVKIKVLFQNIQQYILIRHINYMQNTQLE